MRREKGFTLIELMIVIAIIAIIAAIAIPGLLRSTMAANEKSAIGTMRDMTSTESLWRAKDLDRNGIPDYWVADVGCMYRIERSGAVAGIPLAELAMQVDVARADGDPFTPAGGVYYPATINVGAVNLLASVGTVFSAASPPRAKAGYLYEALVNDNDGNSFIPAVDDDGQGMNANDINRFGFVAYPEIHNTSGSATFLIDNSGTVFKADLGVQAATPYNYSHPGRAAILEAPWGGIE